MAKGDKDKAAPDDKGGDGAAGWDAIPEALRDAGRRASEMAQNPYARSLLAAGLVAAAAALASNKNVRDATRRNLRTATEAVEVGADNAGKIGLAIVNAATEAVQHLLSLGGLAAAAEADVSKAAAPKAATAKSASPRKAAAPKPKAAAAPKPKAAAAPKPAAKPKEVAPAAAAKPAARKAPAKAAATKAPAKAAAKPAARSRAKKDA